MREALRRLTGHLPLVSRSARRAFAARSIDAGPASSQFSNNSSRFSTTSRPLIDDLESRLLMANLFVATTGSDSASGSITAPFRTIQRAAALAVPGDVVNIRAGTYRETVTPARSGTSSAPIVFQAYNGETVTVSGADRLTGFSSYSGNIFKAAMPSNLGDGMNQVFVNGTMINEARWPNQPVGDVSHVNTSSFASATYSVNSTTGWATATITDPALTQSAGFWVGATIHSAMGASGVIVSGTVTASSPGSLTFSFVPNDTAYLPETGDKYFITGKLSLLDTGGEWYRDSAGTLYAQTPDGSNPNNVTLEIKTRTLTFDLQNRSYISLSGLNTFAGTIKMNGSTSGVVIDDLNAKYLSHFTKTEPRKYGGQLTQDTDSGIYLRGTNNVLKNSEIAYSAGNGVHLIGTNLTVTNNIIHDVNYAGIDGAGINTLFNDTVNLNHTITNNTVYNTARSGIMISGMKNSTVTNNDVFNFGLQTADYGGIYCYDSDGAGTVVAFNKVHDGFNDIVGFPGAGLYFDERSRNYVIHHNLSYNVPFGMIVNGSSTNQKIYNNTIVGSARGLSTLSNKIFPQTAFTNNIIFGSVNTADFPQATFTTNLYNSAAVNFAWSGGGNYQLSAGSAGIDSGSFISGITTSLVGNVDIGAFEFGKSAWTAGANRSTVPNTPTSLTAAVLSSSSIRLNWAQSGGNVSNFYIERSTDGSVFTLVSTVGASTFTYTDANLTSSTQYFYRVRADDSGYTATANGKTNYGVGSVIQAEDYSAVNGVTDYSSGLGSLDTGDWIRLDNFDFRNGSNQFSARIGLPSGVTGRKIEIRTGSSTGTLIGTLNIQPTGGYQTFTTQTTSITPTTGIKTLYLVFTGGSGAGNLDWYSFNQTTTPVVDPPTTALPILVQAETYSAASGVVNYGTGIGGLDAGDWVRVDNLNLQGANQFSARVALGGGLTGRKIEVRTGSTTGTLLGTLNLQPTANWDTAVTQSTSITPVGGATSVYLVFAGGNGVGNIDWYSFGKAASINTTLDPLVIQAESYSNSSGIVNYGPGIGSLDTGDWVRVDNVNLQGRTTFNAQLAVGHTLTGRKIEIRTGSPTGTLLGTLNVQGTGGWGNYTTQSTTITPVSTPVTLYLVFAGGSGVGNMNWYSFT